MLKVPKKTEDRIKKGLTRFSEVVRNARTRDINEADTVMIVTDILSEVLGYDKYAEITAEKAIRGTYCDLAIKVDGRIRMIVEVKAIGIDLKEQHAKQAVDYCANEGVEWTILTNGIEWHVYNITFGKPIGAHLLREFDLLGLSRQSEEDISLLYVLSREGLQRNALEEYQAQRRAMDKYLIAAVLRSDIVLQVLKRELRRVYPDVSVDVPEIERTLLGDVLKREVIDGEGAQAAEKLVTKAAKRMLRSRNQDKDQSNAPDGSEAQESKEPASEDGGGE